MSSSGMITIKTNYQGDNRRFRIARNATFHCLQEQVKQVYSISRDQLATSPNTIQLSSTTTFTKLPGTVSVVTDTFADDIHWAKIQQRAVASAVGEADPVVKLLVELVPSAVAASAPSSSSSSASTLPVRASLLADIRNGRSGSRSNTAGTTLKPQRKASLPADLRAAIRGRPTLNAAGICRQSELAEPSAGLAKYTNMLRVQVPFEAVVNKMKVDGVVDKDSDPAKLLKGAFAKSCPKAAFLQALKSGRAKLSERSSTTSKSDVDGREPLLRDIRNHRFRKLKSSSSERIAAKAGVSYADVTYVVNPFKKDTEKVAPTQSFSSSPSSSSSSSERIAAEAGVKYSVVTNIVNPFKKGAEKLGLCATDAAVTTMSLEARKYIVQMLAQNLGVACTFSA